MAERKNVEGIMSKKENVERKISKGKISKGIMSTNIYWKGENVEMINIEKEIFLIDSVSKYIRTFAYFYWSIFQTSSSDDAIQRRMDNLAERYYYYGLINVMEYLEGLSFVVAKRRK
jgi:hypothetical protein